MNEYKHLSLYERQRIERYLRAEKSLRFIANKLGRSISSVSDEVRLNSVRGVYDAKKASHKAYTKRKYSKIQCMKVATDSNLQKFVKNNLKEDQSPEGISGRLKSVERCIRYASTKAIYKFVYSTYGRQIEKFLYSKAVHKKSGPKRGKSISIDGRAMIDERPKRVENRREFGHFEGDFIESGKDGKGSLLMLVERKTRYPFLQYLEDRTTENVNRVVGEMLDGIPIESLTIDNDISFQKHKELSALLEAEIFFCHPQAPYEKGTVENRNKAVRRYIKKRSDLSSYSKETFMLVENKLRDKYMKCLKYKTPREVFVEEIKKINTKKSTVCGILKKELLLTESVRIEGCV